MPKSSPATIVGAAGLILAGILAGIGGTTAWGSLCQRVDGHTRAITRIEQDREGLAPAVIELRIAVAELSQQIKSHKHTAHLHEGND